MGRRWLAPMVLLLLFGGIYSGMAPPGLDWGDSGEAQLAAATAGLSHPTGYPLYLILGRLWSRLLALVGLPPTRAMTLFSVWTAALAVALTVPMMRALLRRLGQGRVEPVAVVTALFWGFSLTFWSQAIIAEVYALNLLLLVLLLWGLWAPGLERRLPLLALLYGVALGHHRTALLWAPGLLLWLRLESRQRLGSGRWALLLVLVALPQLVYLYVPWRGPLTPYLNQPVDGTSRLVLYDGTLAAFLTHVSGTAFAGDLTLTVLLGDGARTVVRLAWQNLTLLPLFWLFWLGRGALRRWRPADLLLLGSIGVSVLLFGLIFGVGDADVMMIPTWFVVTLVGMGSWGVALGPGTTTRPDEPHRPGPASGARVWLWLTAGLLLAAQLLVAPPSLRGRDVPRRFAGELLAAAPPNAILLSTDRNEMVPLWYLQFAEGARQDVLVLFPLVTRGAEHATLAALAGWATDRGRPVLLARDVPILGLLYEIRPAAGPLVEIIGRMTPPAAPVRESEIGEDLRVTGWALSPPRPVAGGRSHVAIAIESAARLPDDATFSLQLFDDQGTRLAQEELPPSLDFLPSEWPLDLPLRLSFAPDLPAVLPEGVLEWRLTVYRPDGDGLQPIGRQVVVGRSVLPPPTESSAGRAPRVAWQTGIQLLEIEAPTSPRRAGEEISFALLWGTTAQPARDYTLFVHLVDESGQQIAQADGPLVPPTDSWLPGDLWREQRTVPLPPGTPPGRYRVRSGLYIGDDRLELVGGGDSVDLFEIEVVE